MRVLFFGSSDYCLPILHELKENFSLVGIITRQDKPVGRNKHITPSAPKLCGIEANIPVFTPKDKTDLLNTYTTLDQLHPDIAVVADYGILIPAEIFTLPKQQTINIHFSKLPEFRGAAPVQYTLLRGDTSSWITIQKLSEELDAGDILWQREQSIDPDSTTDSLYRKLFTIAAKTLPDVIKEYAAGAVTARSQNPALATYTRRLTRADGYIPRDILPIPDRNSYDDPGSESKMRSIWPLYTSVINNLYANLQPTTYNLQRIIDRVFRAFSPWPGLWTTIGIRNHESGVVEEKRLKILKLHLEPSTTNSPLQTQSLVIDEVQLEGKQPMSWKQFQDLHHLHLYAHLMQNPITSFRRASASPESEDRENHVPIPDKPE